MTQKITTIRREKPVSGTPPHDSIAEIFIGPMWSDEEHYNMVHNRRKKKN